VTENDDTGREELDGLDRQDGREGRDGEERFEGLPKRGSAELKAILEALIFASPEPLTPKAMYKLLDTEPKEDVQAALADLKQDYERPGGLQLVEVAGGFQIVTRSDLHDWVRRLFDERTTQKLTVQALETVAVIAYRQPITAAEITEVRGVREYVYPVGRLDYESEGLLLLTNDGDLAARLTHPSHGVARVYEARVLGVPDAHDLDRLTRGLVIDGRRTAPAEVKLLPAKREANEATLVLTVREGRNRQVRKMCDAIGHPVDHLKRVAIGPIRDAKLKLGRWRELNQEEVTRLKKMAGSPPAARG